MRFWEKSVKSILQTALLSLATASLVILSSLGNYVPSQAAAVSAGPGHKVSQPSNQMLIRPQGSNSKIIYYNWSGYAATASAPFIAVQSLYIQPTVTCTVPGAWTLFWVGFDGFQNGTVEQAGTAAQCSTDSHPVPTYYAWWEMYPTNTIQIMPLNIKPGDSILAKTLYNSTKASYSLTVNDRTTAQHFTKVTTCAPGLTCSRQSADWIVERPTLNSVYTPLANWNTMQLKADQAAIAPKLNHPNQPNFLPVSSFSNTPIDMVDYPYTGKTLATVGPLNSNGQVFTDTWLAAQ